MAATRTVGWHDAAVRISTGAVRVIASTTTGAGWLAVSRAVLEEGAAAAYDQQPTRELALVTLVVEEPASDDPIVAELGDPDWLAWMHDNFVGHGKVPELGDADSYAVRLTMAARAATRSHGSSTGCAPTPSAARQR